MVQLYQMHIMTLLLFCFVLIVVLLVMDVTKSPIVVLLVTDGLD